MESGPLDDLLGAVLAGGASRRMGRDKATIEIAGRTMLERAVSRLRSLCREIVVVGPHRQESAVEGVSMVSDIHPHAGPLGGLHTALSRAAGRAVFVLACDLPNVSPGLLQWIVRSPSANREEPQGLAGSAGPWARVPRDRQEVQPLCGLYSGDCLSIVEKALGSGRLSVLDLLENLDLQVLDLDATAVWYRPGLLANINRPEDLAAVHPQPEVGP